MSFQIFSYLLKVSILRAGETMEAALTEVCKDIRVGKILIQSDPASTDPEPSLYYLRLPKDIKVKVDVSILDVCEMHKL